MKNNIFPFPLSVQTVFPADYLVNNDFQEDLSLLTELGVGGVELNIAQPEKEGMDCQGTVAVEGNLRSSFGEDIRSSGMFLSRLPVTLTRELP